MIKKLIWIAIVVFLALLAFSVLDANAEGNTYTVCKVYYSARVEVCKEYLKDPTATPTHYYHHPKEKTSTPSPTIYVPKPTSTKRPTPTMAPTETPNLDAIGIAEECERFPGFYFCVPNN